MTTPTHGPIYRMVEDKIESLGKELTMMHSRSGGKTVSEELSKILPKIQELEPRWIPVTERLPEVGVKVLLYSNGNQSDGALDEHETDRFFDSKTNEWFDFEPTHWQPLPLPPTE